MNIEILINQDISDFYIRTSNVYWSIGFLNNIRYF
jgi:hypothetical protein